MHYGTISFSDISLGIFELPIELTQDTISVSNFFFKNFSATHPAATRPIVSLALDLPPPEAALIPYLLK